MKPVLVISAASLLVLFGAAASNAANSDSTPSYAAPVISDADAMKAADKLKHVGIRQQLQDDLAKAGYTDVKIMPSSFLVEAKDKKGAAVEMVIGPDSITEVTELTPKASGSVAEQTPKTPNMTK
jgi:hypothetical protein